MTQHCFVHNHSQVIIFYAVLKHVVRTAPVYQQVVETSCIFLQLVFQSNQFYTREQNSDCYYQSLSCDAAKQSLELFTHTSTNSSVFSRITAKF